MILKLIGILGLGFLNTLFTVCEYSLIKLGSSRLDRETAESFKQQKDLIRLFKRSDDIIRLMRLGGIVCAFGCGCLFYSLIYSVLEPQGGESLLGLVSLLLALLGTVVIYCTIGELVPRGLALNEPVAIFTRLSPILKVSSFFSGPLLAIFLPPSRYLLKLFGIREDQSLIPADLTLQLEESFESEGPILENVSKSALQMRKLTAQDVFLPRNQVQFLNLLDNIKENIEVARKSGHTRFPLCEGDLDHCIGIVHIKDVFRTPGDIENIDLREIKRNIVRVRAEESLELVLQKLMSNKKHMGLVVDEFDGTMGVITLEHILEELVGEIQDEFDSEEALIKPIDQETHLVSALTPVHELEEALDIKIENENDVASFGGLITSELGRIPAHEEKLKIQGMEIRVTEVDETRVINAQVKLLKPASEDAEN